MSTINIRGTVIGYTDSGAPDGLPNAPAIVFGHGLLFSGWMFHSQIAVLKDRYRCVAIDWRGQGETPATPGGYDMDSLTGDAVALIRELGIAPVHWAGLSMGGFVGQRIAARHGELLRSLTLLDTSADADAPGKASDRRRLALFQLLFGMKPILGKVKPLLFGPAFLADPASRELLDEWVRRLGRSRRTAIRKAVLGVVERAPMDAEIGRIAVPTLVVVGADDKATPPEHAERIAARIPDATLRIVPDCGHSSTLEQPAAITGLLEEFLRVVDLGGAGQGGSEIDREPPESLADGWQGGSGHFDHGAGREHRGGLTIGRDAPRGVGEPVPPRGIDGDRDDARVEAAEERDDEIQARREEQQCPAPGRAALKELGRHRERPRVQVAVSEHGCFVAMLIQEQIGLPGRVERRAGGEDAGKQHL